MNAESSVAVPRVRRRRLRFESLDEVVVDVGWLAGQSTRQLGNWSLAQICQHLGTSMELSTSAERLFSVPLGLRIMGRLVRRRVLSKGVPSGFQLPPAGAAVLVPPEVSLEDGLAQLDRGIAALDRTSRRAAHPVFGALNVDQWYQFHLRHAEMHLSFIVPAEAA